jgi:hypothetical protein
VNVRAVRRSLAKQIFAAYLKQAGEGDHPDALTRRWAATAVEAAEPLVTRLLSLDALSKLFGEGSLNTALPNMPPQTVVPSPSETDAPVRAASGLRMGLASLTWARILTSVETRGFRTFHLTLPQAPGIAGHVRLSFRLNSWTWRLNGIELPDLLVRQLADELLKRPVKRSADPTSSGP